MCSQNQQVCLFRLGVLPDLLGRKSLNRATCDLRLVKRRYVDLGQLLFCRRKVFGFAIVDRPTVVFLALFSEVSKRIYDNR